MSLVSDAYDSDAGDGERVHMKNDEAVEEEEEALPPAKRIKVAVPSPPSAEYSSSITSAKPAVTGGYVAKRHRQQPAISSTPAPSSSSSAASATTISHTDQNAFAMLIPVNEIAEQLERSESTGGLDLMPVRVTQSSHSIYLICFSSVTLPCFACLLHDSVRFSRLQQVIGMCIRRR